MLRTLQLLGKCTCGLRLIKFREIEDLLSPSFQMLCPRPRVQHSLGIQHPIALMAKRLWELVCSFVTTAPPPPPPPRPDKGKCQACFATGIYIDQGLQQTLNTENP